MIQARLGFGTGKAGAKKQFVEGDEGGKGGGAGEREGWRRAHTGRRASVLGRGPPAGERYCGAGKEATGPTRLLPDNPRGALHEADQVRSQYNRLGACDAMPRPKHVPCFLCWADRTDLTQTQGGKACLTTFVIASREGVSHSQTAPYPLAECCVATALWGTACAVRAVILEPGSLPSLFFSRYATPRLVKWPPEPPSTPPCGPTVYFCLRL